VVDSK